MWGREMSRSSLMQLIKATEAVKELRSGAAYLDARGERAIEVASRNIKSVTPRAINRLRVEWLLMC